MSVHQTDVASKATATLVMSAARVLPTNSCPIRSRHRHRHVRRDRLSGLCGAIRCAARTERPSERTHAAPEMRVLTATETIFRMRVPVTLQQRELTDIFNETAPERGRFSFPETLP